MIVLSCNNIVVKSLARKSLGQYAGLPKNKETDRMNVTELMYQLNITYTNTYSFLLWDTNGNNYLDLVLLLDYLALNRAQDGNSGLKLSVTLIPPSESLETANTKCSIFVDSPLTNFNETSMLNLTTPSDPHGCLDYIGQANILNHLSLQYPDIIESINIDDFSVNLNVFTEKYCTQFKQTLQNVNNNSHSNVIQNMPKFIPTYYYGKNGVLLINQTKFQYLTSVLDGVLFYFRNDKAGKETCLPCKFIRRDVNCSMPCLYNTCSEKSIPNFTKELADILNVVKNLNDYTLLIGIYFTAYSHCGPTGPSIFYNYEILRQSLSNEHVNGVVIYTMKSPSTNDLKK